jgi:hypothetical protein
MIFQWKGTEDPVPAVTAVPDIDGPVPVVVAAGTAVVPATEDPVPVVGTEPADHQSLEQLQPLPLVHQYRCLPVPDQQYQLQLKVLIFIIHEYQTSLLCQILMVRCQ